MRPKTLDHVALWVADRDRIADFATERLSMHVIERTDKFTLVGTDARRGKLTLFEAEGPRERGALKHVALRVNDLEARCRDLDGVDLERTDGMRTSTSSKGSGSVSRGAHRGRIRPRPCRAVLRRPGGDGRALPPPRLLARRRPSRGGRRRVGRVPRWRAGHPERPLLNHLAVLVDSSDEHLEEARELGIEVADVVDAANTCAVFLWGPERVKIEYVEHKPTFALK